MSISVFREKFENFLSVRSKQLIVTGDCWKMEFINYLNTTTNVFKDLQIITEFNTINQVLKAAANGLCCQNIWAILHIEGK